MLNTFLRLACDKELITSFNNRLNELIKKIKLLCNNFYTQQMKYMNKNN